jgi:hypothetical protein
MKVDFTPTQSQKTNERQRKDDLLNKEIRPHHAYY